MRLIVLAISVMAVGGCTRLDQPLSAADVAQIKGDISYLKSSAEMHENFIESLQGRVGRLEGLATGGPNIAYLDPAGGSGYQYIETNVSPIIVSFVDSSAIGDGTKARLRVGNLSSAMFSGIEFDVTYNRRAPQQPESMNDWAKGAMSITAKDARDIPAGAWTIVEVSLPGLKPEELGYLAVKAKLDTLVLRRPL